MPVSEMPLDLGDQGLGLAEDTILDLRGQVLVRKIDRRFEMSENPGQAITPAVVEAAKLAVQLTTRLTPLCFGLGLDEIGDRLGLQQIELAVVKRAAGELAGFGEAQTESAEHAHDRGKYGAAAMQMKLGDILTGSAVRSREPQHQPIVELLSGGGIDEVSALRDAWLWELARDP